MNAITKQTRRESYLEVLNDLSNRQKTVMEALEVVGVGTANELALYLYQKGIVPNFSRNYVHPRLTELVALGKVEIVRKKLDKITNRECNAYRIVGSGATETNLEVNFTRTNMVDTKDFCLMVLEEFGDGATANEVAMKLYVDGLVSTFDRHYVSMPLNLLEKEGKVEIVGKKLDSITGKKTAVFKLKTK